MRQPPRTAILGFAVVMGSGIAALVSAGGMLSDSNVANPDTNQILVVLTFGIISWVFLILCLWKFPPPRSSPPTFQDIYEGKS